MTLGSSLHKLIFDFTPFVGQKCKFCLLFSGLITTTEVMYKVDFFVDHNSCKKSKNGVVFSANRTMLDTFGCLSRDLVICRPIEITLTDEF